VLKYITAKGVILIPVSVIRLVEFYVYKSEVKMAVYEFDISKEIRKRMLAPYAGEHANKFPLFKKSDTYNKAESLGEPDNFIDPIWELKVENNYTSPRNVRKLIFSKEAIVTDYWQPIVINGSTKDKKMTNTAYLYPQQPDKRKNLKVVFKGKPALHGINRWALSNIEEIYMDVSALCCESFNTLDISKIPGNTVRQHFEDTIQAVFYGEFRNRYRRLKRIAFIGTLDKGVILNLWNRRKDIGIYLDELNNSGNMVFTHTGDIISNNQYNINFTASPNLYQFDKDYLVDYFRDLSRKIDRGRVKPSLATDEPKKEAEDTNKPQEVKDIEDLFIGLLSAKLVNKNTIIVNALRVLGEVQLSSYFDKIDAGLLEKLKPFINKAFDEKEGYIG